MLLCAALLFFVFVPAFAALEPVSLADLITQTFDARRAHTTKSATLLDAEGFTGDAVSSFATDWIALAMGRFGVVAKSGKPTFFYPDAQTQYLTALGSTVSAAYRQNDGYFSKTKVTEGQRCALAVTALGGDPTRIGTYQNRPINLLADNTYNSRLAVTRQGIMGVVFALIAKHAKAFAQPENVTYTDAYLYEYLLARQLPAGGWTLRGDLADADVTAMTLCALAYAKADETVYTVTNETSGKATACTIPTAIENGVAALSRLQLPDGSYASGGVVNCESAAQVLTALCTLGIDPTQDARFVKNGASVLDALLRFRLNDGSFSHKSGGAFDSMATDQAAYALVACWRRANGLRALYDMRADGDTPFLRSLQRLLQNIRDLLLHLAALYQKISAG